MSRPCSVCTHEARVEIDAALVSPTETSRDVAQRYGLSTSATSRHLVAHLPKALSQAVAGQEAIRAKGLQDRILTYIADLQRLRRKAERRGEYSVAISAVRELTRLAELEARAQGHLRAPASGPSVAVQVNAGSSESWSEVVRHARLVLQVEADEQADLAQAPALVAAGGQP